MMQTIKVHDILYDISARTLWRRLPFSSWEHFANVSTTELSRGKQKAEDKSPVDSKEIPFVD